VINTRLSLLNKITTGVWWVLLFFCTLILAFLSVSREVTTIVKVSKPNALLWIAGGIVGVLSVIIGILLLAVLLLVISWFFRAGVSYTTYVRIATIDALLRLLIGLLPASVVQTSFSEGVSAIYLSLAIFVVIPEEKRTYWMLFIGLMPTILILVWDVSQWIINRA
jgi:hypothetical protein